MADGWYRLSLIVTHPRRSPDEITAHLKLDPDECWDAGAAELVGGHTLSKRHKSTGWRKTLVDTSADDLKLAKALARVLGDLKGSEAYLRQLADVGGLVTLEVFGDWVNMSQVVISPGLISDLASLKVELVLW